MARACTNWQNHKKIEWLDRLNDASRRDKGNPLSRANKSTSFMITKTQTREKKINNKSINSQNQLKHA